MKVAADAAGQRLERWLKHHFPALPYGNLQKLLRTGQIRVDGHRVKGSTVLAAGQDVRLPPFLHANAGHIPAVTPAQAKKLQEAVLYEDDALMAFYKPAGLATQGGTGQKTSMDNQVRAVFGENLRVLHRLDKGTSGVILFAKTRAVAEHLGHQFKNRQIQKQYIALVTGRLAHTAGEIDAPLLKEDKIMQVNPAGLPAQTRYEVIDAPEPGYMWVRVWPLTGRMHQIRAHLAAAGTPIVGDAAYGGRPWAESAVQLGRASFMLHAESLAIEHPITGKKLVVQAPFALP